MIRPLNAVGRVLTTFFTSQGLILPGHQDSRRTAGATSNLCELGKEGAAPTRRKGHELLAAWYPSTRECLTMLLRPGNAVSNTFTRHRDVPAAAIRITAADEDAIKMVSAGAWRHGIAQDGSTEEDKAPDALATASGTSRPPRP